MKENFNSESLKYDLLQKLKQLTPTGPVTNVEEIKKFLKAKLQMMQKLKDFTAK